MSDVKPKRVSEPKTHEGGSSATSPKKHRQIKKPGKTNKARKERPLSTSPHGSSKSERDYNTLDYKFSQKSDFSEKKKKVKEEVKIEIEQDAQLLAVIKNLESQNITYEFLLELEQLLSNPKFRIDFIQYNGIELLLILLVKNIENKLILKILSILATNVAQDNQVLENVFTKKAYLVTTIVMLLVKIKNAEPVVTCKIYELIGTLPQLAKKENYSGKVIQNVMLSFFTLYNQKSGEKRRFQQLLLSLDQSSSSMDLKVSIMHLINQIIQMHSELEPRISMRLEFSSLNIETILSKIYEEGSQQLRKEIDIFKEDSINDTREYERSHQVFAKAQKIEGHDLTKILEAYSERYASSPNLQKIIAYSLSDLLHIPVDDTHGTSKWLFISKVAAQLSSNYKNSFLEEDIDLEIILNQIINTEIEMKDKLEEKNKLIDKLKNKINLLEESISLLQKKLVSQDSNQSEFIQLRQQHTEKVEELQNDNSILSEKLTNALNSLNQETEKALHYQSLIEEHKIQLELNEKKYSELEEKSRAFWSSPELATIPPSPQLRKMATVGEIPLMNNNKGSHSPEVPRSESNDSIHDLMDKEERRLNTALSKYSFPKPRSATLASPPIGQNNRSTSTINLPTKPEVIKDWKKRQLEKEFQTAQKAEKELQKKLETLKSVSLEPKSEQQLPPVQPVHQSQPSTQSQQQPQPPPPQQPPQQPLQPLQLLLQLDDPSSKLNTESVPEWNIILPEEEITEKELLRLEKTINNRFSIKK